MSTLIGKKPISVVIFDRTQAGLSDVPVFAAKLKEKVNTPVPEDISRTYLSPKASAILASIHGEKPLPTVSIPVSVLRADSSGGQTGEFAQSTELVSSPPVPISVQPETVRSEVADDPALVRIEIPLIELDTILRELASVKPVVPRISVPKPTKTLLHTHHRDGYFERGEIPTFAPYSVQSLLEVAKFESIQIFKKIRQLRKGMPEISLPTVNWPSKVFIPKFNFVSFTSKALLAGSLVLMLLTVGPMVALEIQSIAQKISYSLSTVSSHAQESNVAVDTKPTPVPSANPDPDKQFQIIIPKIGVNSKVIANVDAANEKEYTAALKKGVAHAAGTGLPGEENSQNKTIFIFGHSTNGEWNIERYNALFYALRDMIVGDTFSVWFWGKEFHYQVKETKIVAANDVSFLLPQTDKDQIILQTCWPPGTSWKRFLVIAEPVK